MENLPSWPGASVVYSRVMRINEALCKASYEAQQYRRKSRKPVPFSVPEDVQSAIDALNRGDEEFLKAYVQHHLSLALA